MSLQDAPIRPGSAGSSNEPHPVDRVPPLHKLLVFGLQHLCIMYAGAVAVPLIVGPAVGLNSGQIATLVSADLLVSGIATIIQSAGIGKIFGVRLRWSPAPPSPC
jgi:xanthine/uracil permease